MDHLVFHLSPRLASPLPPRFILSDDIDDRRRKGDWRCGLAFRKTRWNGVEDNTKRGGGGSVPLSPQILSWERSTQSVPKMADACNQHHHRQGSHLRDIRNPIRGFDLHKPTLDRVTRGHLTSAHLHAAASKDGRCSFAAIFAIMRSDHSTVAHPPCPFFDLRFQVNHPLCRPSLRLVSRLRETWQTWPTRSNRSLRGRGETMENQDIILSPGFLI